MILLKSKIGKMTFRQRLNRFLIGLGIGTLICFVLFGQRDWFDWAPNARVLKRLNETELMMTERAKCLMDCRGISQDHIHYLIENGDVKFGESKVQQDPIIYIVEAAREKEEKYQVTFEARDSTSTVVDAQWLNREVACGC